MKCTFTRTNLTTYELGNEERNLRVTGKGEKVFIAIINVVFYPLLAITAMYALIDNLRLMCCNKIKIQRTIKVLKDTNKLKEYSDKRLAECDKQIQSLKEQIVMNMEIYPELNPEKLGLPPFPKRSIFQDYMKHSREFYKPYWDNFSWETFVNLDLEKFIDHSNEGKEYFINKLRMEQQKLKFWTTQKQVLSKNNEVEKIEKIKNILLLSVVKNSLNYFNIASQNKIWLVVLLPFGLLYKNKPVTFNRFSVSPISQVEDLKDYKDLITAHNDLIKNHNYLVPYFTH